MKLKCKFGIPHNGWLPVTVTKDDFLLEFEASDVPTNPMGLLIPSLSRALSGFESEVWWHLEPTSYYFNFAPTATNQFSLSISVAEDDSPTSKHQIIFETSGNKDEIILPFWRAIKEFLSHNYSEPHWAETHQEGFKQFTIQLKNE